jgi:hypothetical protein
MLKRKRIYRGNSQSIIDCPANPPQGTQFSHTIRAISATQMSAASPTVAVPAMSNFQLSCEPSAISYPHP